MTGEELLLFGEKGLFSAYVGGGRDQAFFSAKSQLVADLAFPGGYVPASDLSMTLLVDLV